MDYIQGQTIWPYALFTDIAGDPVDPTVTVILQHPDGTTTNPTASMVVAGKWHFELDLVEAGIYRWEFHGNTAEGNTICKGQACATASLMAVS